MRTTGPNQPIHLLLDVLDIVRDCDVSYAMVGAMAVSFHGVPRATKDGDAVLWLRGPIGFQQISARLSAAGYSVDARAGDLDDPIGKALLVKDAHGNLADLLMDVRGMDPGASARCVRELVLDSTVSILGAEDLIAMKVSAGGPQDIADVRGILAVSGDRLDLRLLKAAARRYGRSAARRLNALLKGSGAA
jgi:hypothetical protein